jgi:IS30 family transposase
MDPIRRHCRRPDRQGRAVKTDIRQAVLTELRRQSISPNQLAAMVAGHVHRSHVYDFAAGRKDLSTAKANHLLRALRLTIKPRES